MNNFILFIFPVLFISCCSCASNNKHLTRHELNLLIENSAKAEILFSGKTAIEFIERLPSHPIFIRTIHEPPGKLRAIELSGNYGKEQEQITFIIMLDTKMLPMRRRTVEEAYNLKIINVYNPQKEEEEDNRIYRLIYQGEGKTLKK